MMKSYAITVNGVVYDVTVEERGTAFTAPVAPVAAPVTPVAPVAAPAATPAAPAPVAAPVNNGTAGSINVESQIQGKVLRIEAGVGTSVNAGDNVIVIEAMKMEIPIVAPEAGTIASINVKEGDMIDAGTLIATMN